MYKIPLLLALVVWMGSVITLNAQSRFKPKETWLYEASFDQHLQQGTQQYEHRVYRITIISVNNDGSANAQAVLLSAAGKGKNYHFNTADQSSYEVNDNMLLNMQLLYQPLLFKIFPNDSIGQPTNTAAVSAATAASLGLPADWQAVAADTWNQLPYYLIGAIAPFPAKLIPHYQWASGAWNYKVTEVLPETVTITGVKKMIPVSEWQKPANISFTLSRSTKRVLTCSWQDAISNAAPANSYQIISKCLPPAGEPALADTSFFNALVRLNYLSNALVVQNELDSAKVADFLALNMPRYGERLPFKIAMLSLNRGDDSYIEEVYTAALHAVPGYALANNPSGLFNKLQHVSVEGADTAMALIRLLSVHKKTLNDWLDQAFYQTLMNYKFDSVEARKTFVERGLSENAIQRIFEEGRGSPVVAQEIITRLSKEKDSLIQVSIKPMAWWNKINHTTDTAILKSMVTQLGTPTAAEMTWGKAARYQLMVYDILQKAHLEKEAATLLDKALTGLTQNQADTVFWTANPDLKDKKYANRQILAHAYHLKYQEMLPRNKDTALRYLALAAANAPKHNEEKVYESFYDRISLNAKEDYTEDFAAALVEMGRPEEAMKVISRQLMTQPEILDQVKTLFEKQFPGKSFSEYFRNVLLKEWDQAPDFVLEGIKKEAQFRLADYKGKWLLLDFWGSWCGPCRADLPHMDQLAKDINTGQYPGTALLAIACGEPLDITRDFLGKTTYTFPAAHSDKKVEYLYKVRGFPTKVLVSPDGKMLDLQFGTDYAAMLKMYSNMYAQQEKQPSTINIKNKKKD